MTLNLLSLLLFISSVFSVFLSFYAWQRRKNKAAVYLSMLMISTTLWSLCYGLEISLSNLFLMRIVASLSYIGISTLPAFFLLFSIRYSGYNIRFNRKILALLFLIPLITLISVSTNEWHYLFYSQVALGFSKDVFYLNLTHSYLYYVHIIYSHICVVSGIIIVIRMLPKVSASNRKRGFIILAGASVPYLTNLAYVFGIRPYGFLDLTPVGFFVMGAVLSTGVFTVKLFEITPLALDILFDNIPDAIFVTDTNNVVLNSNPSANMLMQHAGFQQSDILIQQNNAEFQKSCNLSVAGTRTEFAGRVFDRTSKLIRSRKGKIMGVLVILRDITEYDLAVKAMMAAKEKAEESEKLKMAFLTNMSHEIRTPMNGILGFINLLKSMDITSDERTAYVEILNQSGQRLLDTINDIMAMSEIESGMPKLSISKIRVSEMLNFHLKFFSQQAREKGIELKLSLQDNSSYEFIHTDKNKLNAILSNLIKNAIKFTNAGRVELGAKAGNGYLILFVKDTGIGIDQKKQDIIFERFMQADVSNTRQYEGSGLGLSIVKAYVHLLRGEIKIESAPGEGSTFIVQIPELGSDVIQDQV